MNKYFDKTSMLIRNILIQSAHQAFIAGDFDEAEILLLDAQKLFPTRHVNELLHKVYAAKARYRNAARDENPQTDGQTKTPEREYTEEQMDAVRRINEGTDNYDILGVRKDSSHKHVKKVYKKLILLVHPDKNPAPGAAAAFMAVRKAYSIITSDWQKCDSNFSQKANNQRDCPSEPKANTQRDRPFSEPKPDSNTSHTSEPKANTQHNYTSSPKGDTQREYPSPPKASTQREGPCGPKADTRRDSPSSPKANNTQHNWSSTPEDDIPDSFDFAQNHETKRRSNYFSMLYFVVLLISVIIAVIMLYPAPNVEQKLAPKPKLYVLDFDPDLPILRATINLNVPYYVGDNFESDYEGSLPELELSIAKAYFERLIEACEAEKAVKPEGNESFWSAFLSSTPSCDKLVLQDPQTITLRQILILLAQYIWRKIEEFRHFGIQKSN